jgi:1,4-alpha-glucan branching enzyme
MPGDAWQRLANLRAYFGWMWGFPVKKLLFMGGEIAQEKEWDHDSSLSWELLDAPGHRGVQTLIGDLNRLYVGEAALHATDADPHAFSWIIADDADTSVFAFTRRSPDGALVLVVSNMTPVTREGYRIGVPVEGWFSEMLNTDAAIYGGGNRGNGGGASTQRMADRGHPQSLALTLPPLSTLVLRWSP